MRVGSPRLRVAWVAVLLIPITGSHEKNARLTTTRHLQQPATPCDPIPPANLQAAWQWARSTAPRATGMIAYQNGVKTFEQYEIANVCSVLPFFCRFRLVRWVFLDLLGWYPHGGSETRPFAMYSMTKTIAGLAAILLEERGFVTSLNVPASTFITEWAGKPDLSDITILELLTLSSGIDAASARVATVTLADAIDVTVRNPPEFDYGAEPFTIVSRIIELATGGDTEDFLKEYLLDPLGITISFARTPEGVPVLSSGGSAALPDIAILGLELLNAAKGRGLIFTPAHISTLTTPGINPTYGMGCWLNDLGTSIAGTPNAVQPTYQACGATAVFHGIGFGGQILTVVPDHELVVVKSATTGSLDGLGQPLFDFLFEGLMCECVP